jgi:hypothetical protein
MPNVFRTIVVFLEFKGSTFKNQLVATTFKHAKTHKLLWGRHNTPNFNTLMYDVNMWKYQNVYRNDIHFVKWVLNAWAPLRGCTIIACSGREKMVCKCTYTSIEYQIYYSQLKKKIIQTWQYHSHVVAKVMTWKKCSDSNP